jgi:hypothetical protein
VAQAALEQKKYQAIEKWLTSHMSSYYIMLDPEDADCPQLKKWADVGKTYAAF